ncbi:hypothetical protein RB653_010225 [Dictyostelium firmibasis]|uniref:Beta-1,4-mannosyl-glycoprotein beta-1,4-N-acetylglucosaminyltransferase n=1 Tax=Dictyostelium firmibasis TaxID=79012 RepID=A0AAN7YVD5_9MYCE
MNHSNSWALVLICLIIIAAYSIYLLPNITQSEYSTKTENILHTTPTPKQTINKIFTIEKKDYEFKGKNFTHDMNNFPWEDFKAAARTGKTDNTDKYSQMLILTLSTYLIEPPLVSINETCKPEPLPIVNDKVCAKYPDVFSGPRNKSVKIGHMVQIGFDIDVLEIHLNELYDIVDHFFIIEATVTHYHRMKKPLIWEHVKFQDRFIKFQDKVVHLILDDTDEENGKDVFSAENYQETRRWQKFLDWNNRTNEYSDTDIIGFGDTDEISARINLHLLKNCQLRNNVEVVDIGIWFPYGPINQVFKPFYSVPNNTYTLGDPTYYTLGKAKSSKKAPSRNRGTSGHYMLGGMHMSHYGYLPFQMVKYLSCTECGVRNETHVKIFSNDIQNGKIQQLELRLLETKSSHANKIQDISTMDDFFRKEVAILPWFYNCNRNRYPVWERRNDPRLF